MENATVPSFYLFGEPPRPVGDRFLHLEDLDDRTRPNDWNIRPHVHANLNHVFHIARGGGNLRVESRIIPFSAPCLLLIPAGVVHGLSYEVETSGSVLTVSEAYLRELIRREREFASLFAEPSCVPIARPAVVSDILSRLAREVSWEAPGHAAAVEALLMSLFVDTLRRLAVTASARPALGPHAELVARFRARVEDRYRMGDTVEDYAQALAVSPKQLRAACLRAAGAAPLKILQDRIALEAKRMLLYSNMTIAEVGYHLGFADPAYFSRFFAKAAGTSARAFRSEAGAQ